MYKFLIAFIACCLAFNASAATSEILQKSQTSWNNTPIKQMNLTEPEVTVVRIQIPKGEKLPLHQHPILNVGYLTKGELTVHTQTDDVLVLKAATRLLRLLIPGIMAKAPVMKMLKSLLFMWEIKAIRLLKPKNNPVISLFR